MSRNFQLGFKRSMDLLLGLILVVPLLPVVALAAILVRVSLGRPVLFEQVRPGLGERLFTLRKLRTMRNLMGDYCQLADDERRLTLLGKFLRRTSIDELPEIINIVCGEMSFVGPRPLLVDYLPLYSREQARRHSMRPGLTGLAQVSGRNALSWEERLSIDVWYVDNWSLRLDAWILWRTFAAVISGRGVAAEGHATSEPFRGSHS